MNMKDSCLCAAAVVCLVSLLHASAQSVPKVECPSRDPNGNAKVPHPTDCSQYFMCVYGTPVLMPCPAGLHFSSSKQDCDYPEDAKCERNCDILTNDAGGSWTPPGCALGVQPVGSKCTLQCNNNFTLRGSSYVQCTDNGWNSSNGNTIPKCITTECLSKNLVDEMNKTLSVNAGLLFVLDESGSVGKDDFEKTKGFVKDIITKYPLSANRSAGVITFDAYSIVRIPLKESSTSSFMNQVDAISYRGGNTNILEALQNALIEINTNHIHPLTLVLLVTDGISDTDGTPAAVELKANNNPLFTIGVGQTILEHLEALSSIGTNGIKHFFHTRDYGVLKSIGKYINPPTGSSGSNANMNCTSLSIASLLLSALVANFGLLAAAGIEPREYCPISDPLDYSVLLPDPTDCTKYYLCSNGIPVQMSCPSGLNFNNDLQVCDYPENAGCVKQCSALEDGAGGYWTPSSCSSGPNEVGEICSLQCSQDYELKGSAHVECTKDGWNSSNGVFIPKCLPSECIGEDLENDLNETLSVNASLLFVLDESGSVTEPDFVKTKEFVKNIVSKFPLSANRSAGVITFSSNSLVRIHLTENSTSSFLSRVDGIKYRSGGTNILDGLQTALAEIKTYRVHNLTLVFLITDGISETDGTPAADEIKNDNNPLFAIGVGQTKLVHLESLSSAGANGIKHFFHIRNYEVLDSIGKYINGSAGSGGSSNSTQCKNP